MTRAGALPDGGSPALYIPPSGRQYVIVSGQQRAVVVEVGGGVRSYTVDGEELLDGYAKDERATGARGQMLVPWPNRLADGQYSWDGAEHQLPLTEPGRHNAIHGLARWTNWQCRRQTTDEVVLGYLLHPQPGYRFTLDAGVTYRLGADGLTVTTTARNLGTTPLPFAAGQHPYLAAHGRVDDCILSAPGATYLPTDDRGLPTGVRPVDGTDRDFRTGRRLGEVQLDVAFTDLERDADGRAWVELTRPDGRGARLWPDRSYGYVELFTGDSLPDRERRRRGLGVEPMTAPPNGLATGRDIVRIAPGQEVRSQWGMSAIGT